MLPLLLSVRSKTAHEKKQNTEIKHARPLLARCRKNRSIGFDAKDKTIGMFDKPSDRTQNSPDEEQAPSPQLEERSKAVPMV